MDFEGKVAIVTGGNQGIGKAVALRLAQEGADVVIIGRNKAKNEDTLAEIHRSTRDKAEAFAVDITDALATEKMIQTVYETYGHIEILVNNAGTCQLATDFENVSDENWDAVLNVNLKGMLHCIRSVIPIF